MTNTLLSKIAADADSQIASIKATADAQVASIAQETERMVSELQTEAQVALEKKKNQMQLVATAKANQAATIAQQAAKREAIDELFAAVTADMLAESGDAYVARYTKLSQAVVPAGIDVQAIHVPAGKESETKAILTTLGITVELTIDSSVRAGLIVKAADGVYDVSFDRVMSEARPALEMKLIETIS